MTRKYIAPVEIPEEVLNIAWKTNYRFEDLKQAEAELEHARSQRDFLGSRQRLYDARKNFQEKQELHDSVIHITGLMMEEAGLLPPQTEPARPILRIVS